MAIDEHDLAVTDLDEAIAKDPDKSAIYLMRMNANRQRGDFDAVATDFETVKALGNPSALMQAERILAKIVPAS